MSHIVDLPRTDVDWPSALEEVCADPSRVTPVFQPIVDLQRGAVCGYEALSRFDGAVDAGPAEWFTAATLHGYGPALESAVLARMITARHDLPLNCFLSVNVSPVAQVSPEVGAVLDAERDLRGLVLEITEQSPVDDYDELQRSLARCRAFGARVAVDDAGAGYASLRHVLALEPDFVKLDRSLIAGAHQDPRRVAAISAFGAFANSMDAWIVAEGVEEPDELDSLIGLDVPLGQGFLMGRPDRSMAEIGEDMTRQIRAAAQRHGGSGIAGLIEHAPATRDLAGEPPVTLAFGVQTSRILFLVDEFGHPVEVVTRQTGQPEQVHRAMTAARDEDPAQLALRAMARPEGERFAPIACCDEQGRLLGVVRVDRLMHHLAERLG